MQRKEEVKFGAVAMSLPVDLSCLQGGGGADREAALATLEKQLICPICLELFNKPVVILPCQHNLCRKCANELYQPSLFQARTTMLVNSGRFRCPSCRHEVVLDRHGVYGLQRNLLVENIIDVYKQEVSNSNNAASPLPLAPPPAQPTCSDHEGEKVNIYCLTCKVPTCSLCKVFGAHQSCQVAPLTDVYQQQKDELSGGVSSLETVNDKIQALINELEETCRNIEENSKTQKQSVCDKFSRMFSILEDRHKAMTQTISSEQDEKTGHAQAMVRCYGDSVEGNGKLMERAQSSMDEQDTADFVQNSRELITQVISATSSCPAETLKPGYENMSHYKFNFSEQETALRSLDFIKAVEDVPEEPEVEPEPEEPKEPAVQIAEPKQHQETSIQHLAPVVEPVKETIAAVISAPVEPAPAAAPTPTLTPPAPGLLRDSVQPAGADLQLQTDDADLNDEGSGQIKNKEEEEEEEEEEEAEAEGCAAPDSVKNICEHQEGMSTQQCEGGGAQSEAGDWTAQRETEEKQDAQDEEEEEEIQMKEGTGAVFYPGWYRPGGWRRVSPALFAPDTDRHAGDSPAEAKTQTRVCDAAPAVSELQIQQQPPWSQTQTQTQIQEQVTSYANQPSSGPHLLPLSTQLHAQPYFPLPRPPHHSESQSQNPPPPPESQSQPLKMPVELDGAFTPVPQVQLVKQTAGGAGVIEEENEEEEEEDMQGWVCLPGTVDQSFSLLEGSFDLGDGSLDSFSDNNDTTPPRPPEETCSGMDKDKFKLSDGRVEDAEEREQLEEDVLGLNGASELKEKGLGEAGFEAEMMEKGSVWSDERSEVLRNDFSKLEKQAAAMREGSSEVENNTLDAESEAGSSMFAEDKQEDEENSEQPEDFSADVETSVAETEETITSCVSLQAVTLLFYLLAFLVILQRVWAYIGCFICT